MVIGVKCADQLAANHIPVMFSKGKYSILWDFFFNRMEKLDMTNPRLSKGNIIKLYCNSLCYP